MPTRTVLIVDDHPLYREALRETLIMSPQNIQVVEVGNFSTMVEWLTDSPSLDLLLLDLNLPDIPNILGICYLRALHPELPVVVVSAEDSGQVIQMCKCIGVNGFISKSSSGANIRDAVEATLAGDTWFPESFDQTTYQYSELSQLASRFATLTPRQLEVFKFLHQGKLNKQIAYNIGVSETTVKVHVSAIMQKLDVVNRTQAVIAVNKLECGSNPDGVGAVLLASSLEKQSSNYCQ